VLLIRCFRVNRNCTAAKTVEKAHQMRLLRFGIAEILLVQPLSQQSTNALTNQKVGHQPLLDHAQRKAHLDTPCLGNQGKNMLTDC